MNSQYEEASIEIVRLRALLAEANQRAEEAEKDLRVLKAAIAAEKFQKGLK